MGTRHAILAAALLAGCVGTSAPARFFLLTPLADAPERAESPETVVRLANVELPRYLATPEIVVRENANELHLAKYDRWGEPLQDNFSRVLAKNLTILLPEVHVSRFVWEWPGNVDRLVTVAVQPDRIVRR